MRDIIILALAKKCYYQIIQANFMLCLQHFRHAILLSW